MDQAKTGKFIADLRKEKGMTQAELAEHLSVSNKAVSKWETGKCLPDASLMLDLCNLLGITVNELLTGERIEVQDYREKAEETITSVVKLSQEEKQEIMVDIRNRGILTTVIGIILLVAAIYASNVFDAHGIYGLPMGATCGMAGFIGVIISNGIVSVVKGTKMLREME